VKSPIMKAAVPCKTLVRICRTTRDCNTPEFCYFQVNGAHLQAWVRVTKSKALPS